MKRFVRLPALFLVACGATKSAAAWLARATNPRRPAYLAGRDQSRALTSWRARLFGAPRDAAHVGNHTRPVRRAYRGAVNLSESFRKFASVTRGANISTEQAYSRNQTTG